MQGRPQTAWVYYHLGPEKYAGTLEAERTLLLQGFLKQSANVAGNAPAQLLSHLMAPRGELMPSYLALAAYNSAQRREEANYRVPPAPLGRALFHSSASLWDPPAPAPLREEVEVH